MVCRQLGYADALEAVTDAYYGQGEGTIVLDNVQCTGAERNLTECLHTGFVNHDCRHSEDASVVCLLSGVYGVIRHLLR